MANQMIEEMRARIIAQARAVEECEHKEAVNPSRLTEMETNQAHSVLFSLLRQLTAQEVIELLRID